MELQKYLITLKENIDSGKYDDRLRGNDETLGIFRTNQIISLGGTFDDLASFMLRDPYWTFSNRSKGLDLLDSRRRAFRDYDDSVPKPKNPNYLDPYKEDIVIPRGNISFHNDEDDIGGFIEPIQDIKNRTKPNPEHYTIPMENFWTNIILNGASRGSTKSSAEGVAYFGKYALGNNLDFAVGPYWKCGVSGLYFPKK